MPPSLFNQLVDESVRVSLDKYNSEILITEWTVPVAQLDYGSIGAGIPINEYPIKNDLLNRRYPQFLFTDDYKNVVTGQADQIKFSVPVGMYKQFVSGSTVVDYTGSVYNVAPPKIPSTIKPVYKQDAAQYVVITTNRPEDEIQWYSILTASPLWNRETVENFSDFEFEEF